MYADLCGLIKPPSTYMNFPDEFLKVWSVIGPVLDDVVDPLQMIHEELESGCCNKNPQFEYSKSQPNAAIYMITIF